MRGPVGDEALGADGLLAVLEVEDPVLQPALHVEYRELLVVVVWRQVRLHHDPVREAVGDVEEPVFEDIDPVLVVMLSLIKSCSLLSQLFL